MSNPTSPSSQKPPSQSDKDNPNSDSSSNNTSYISMASAATARRAAADLDADASLVGKNCQYEFCGQLDFLPFYCQSCERTYCLDHRTEGAHKCPKAGAWAERRRLAQQASPSIGDGRRLRDRVSEKPCASPSCRTVVGTSLVPGVHCDGCNRDYCLKHRLQEEHDCKNLPPIGARAKKSGFSFGGSGDSKDGDIAEQARNAFSRLKAWGSAKKEQAASRVLPKPKPTSASARLVAVNNLKKTAKGDDKLAPEKRVYVYVEAEAETTTAKFPKGEFFFSKDWVVGRLLDAAAKGLQVQNVNNQSSDEKDKLRVFHVEGGRVLEYNEKIGTSLQSGNTVVLLRGVGGPPSLIDL